MAKPYTGIARDILLYLAVAGVVAIAATSPYFLYGLLRSAMKEPSGQKKFSNALWRLRKSRLVILGEKKDDTFTVQLTENGRRIVKEIQFGNLSPQKPSHWDGIWRVVIFDIPNKKKLAREALREKLKEWQFYQLQESVWVCPWPCEKEVDFLVELFQIRPYVNIIEASRIKDDPKLRAHFKLL